MNIDKEKNNLIYVLKELYINDKNKTKKEEYKKILELLYKKDS